MRLLHVWGLGAVFWKTWLSGYYVFQNSFNTAPPRSAQSLDTEASQSPQQSPAAFLSAVISHILFTLLSSHHPEPLDISLLHIPCVWDAFSPPPSGWHIILQHQFIPYLPGSLVEAYLLSRYMGSLFLAVSTPEVVSIMLSCNEC